MEGIVHCTDGSRQHPFTRWLRHRMLRGTAQLGSGPLSSPEQLALTLPQREALQVQLRSASVGVIHDAQLGSLH